MITAEVWKQLEPLVKGEFPGEPDGLVDNVSLSYQYESGAFVVESRELGPFGAPNVFASATLRDSDFYFAWVDFANPLSAAGPALPVLSILRNATTVTRSWPAEATGYALETRRIWPVRGRMCRG